MICLNVLKCIVVVLYCKYEEESGCSVIVGVLEGVVGVVFMLWSVFCIVFCLWGEWGVWCGVGGNGFRELI